jgi:hypothetical protein
VSHFGGGVAERKGYGAIIYHKGIKPISSLLFLRYYIFYLYIAYRYKKYLCQEQIDMSGFVANELSAFTVL